MISEEPIIALSKEAGNAILNFYDDEIDVEAKSDNSPLTKADLAAHHIIVDRLKKLTPEIPVISEESGVPDFETRKHWETYWLVDPLDGTKEFIKKNGEFTVNIALIENGIPIFGVVHLPAKHVTYWADRSKGSYKINQKGVQQKLETVPADFSKPVKIVTSRSHGSDKLDDLLKEWGITAGEKVPAGSSLKFCLVAEGTADLYPRLGPTMEWDTAAGDAVYRYSGANDERYSPLTYNKENLLNPGFVIGKKVNLDKGS